jgi:hypothetical protein
LLGKELLATSCLLSSASGLLVKELLTTSSLLAGASGLLVKEPLTTSSLLSSASGLLVDELSAAGCLLLASASGLFLDETEAMVLVRPQFVDGPLPIPVCAVRARASAKKNGPPEWRRRQQSGSLLVFADGPLKPIFVANRATKGVRGGGVVAVVVVEQPLGGAWGGVRPLNMQPPGRIGEVG